MTIQEMKDRKKELGYSNQYLSMISGVPEPTIQKIFSGHTKAPRQATIRQLEAALCPQDARLRETNAGLCYMLDLKKRDSILAEPRAAYNAQPKIHTIEEIYALPEGTHAELIDGQIYFMATPTRQHQEIVGEMHYAVAAYIKAHGGACKVYIPPFAVFLFGDDSTYLEPDLTVVCDRDKLDERGCVGAPDWVVEVLSPSTRSKDMLLKLSKYYHAGVREYWIIDPVNRQVYVYNFMDQDFKPEPYSFEDRIPVHILGGICQIDFSVIDKKIEAYYHE